MKTSSCKAKGRALQKLVCAALLQIGTAFGLEAGDLESRPMGCNGTDVIYSPAAKRALGNHTWECKNVEALNVVATFHDHAAKYPNTIPILGHKKNHTEPLVTLRLKDFMNILQRSLAPTNVV